LIGSRWSRKSLKSDKGFRDKVNAKTTGKVCPKCGKGGYDFWGCTGWSECKG
jgi:ssDNA-binding Zn-finger/Zn-ribbon topoisomerase 1